MGMYDWNSGNPRAEDVDCQAAAKNGDVIVTKQEFRKEADINEIIRRIERSGLVSHVNQREPFFGDVTPFQGLHDALIKVEEARNLFMSYPAEIRNRFSNDPVQFVEFLEDESNRAEAIELGIIDKPVDVAPAPVVLPVSK